MNKKEVLRMDYTKKLLEVRDLHKAYSKEGVPTKALNGITFDVLSGEYLGIMGASGSGKTTLLNCIATVIKPTSGQILLSGANISAFDGACCCPAWNCWNNSFYPRHCPAFKYSSCF